MPSKWPKSSGKGHLNFLYSGHILWRHEPSLDEAHPLTIYGIGFMIATFEYATALARGVDDLHMSAMSTVPEANMRAAFNYGTVLNRQIADLRRKAPTIRWPVTSRVLLEEALGGALDATRHLMSRSREVLATARRGEVRALRDGLLVLGVQRMYLARQPLEILAGERPIEASVFAGMDEAIAEHVLMLTPVIGECAMAYEAVVGRRVVDSKRLTVSERAAAGLGIILPRALGYAVGRAGATVSRVTRRAIRLAYENFKVYQVLDSPIRAKQITQLAVGLRTVSDAEFKEFTELILQVARGAALTNAQEHRLNYFVFRFSARARQAMWLAIIEKELGSQLKPGVHLLQKARPSDFELNSLRRYCALQKKPVVLLPELLPAQYPSGKQVQGARYPDGVLDGELFDLQGTGKNSGVEDVLLSFEQKDSQATEVLKVLTNSAAGIEEVSRRIEEVWANPKILNIDTIILFDGLTSVTHTRPASYIPPFALELMRLTGSQAERMVGLVQQAEAEPL
jgi:hypothetical protein